MVGKRVAVLVRERQEEGLRVALGLTLAGPRVEVYLLDRPPAQTPAVRESLAALAEAGVPVATNLSAAAGLARAASGEIAARLLSCDHVVAF